LVASLLLSERILWDEKEHPMKRRGVIVLPMNHPLPLDEKY
jgi:hypothetical protein